MSVNFGWQTSETFKHYNTMLRHTTIILGYDEQFSLLIQGLLQFLGLQIVKKSEY